MNITHRLLFRLTTAFLLVALVGVVVVAFLANRATSTGFRRYLDAGAGSAWSGLQADLATLYRQQGSWEGATDLLIEAAGAGRGPGSTVLTLVDNQENPIAASSQRRGQGQMNGLMGSPLRLPIEVDGRTVATLQVVSPGQGGGRAAEAYLQEINRAIWLGGFAATLLALALGAWLAYRLTGPLRRLTQATRELAAGNLPQAVVVDDRSELGELAAGFNHMAAQLAETEQQRRRLFADVAHELRTPLSVLRGQLEAMLDGVFPLNAENLAVAHEETVLLGRLVDDLRTLSMAEAGQLTLSRHSLNPSEIISQAAAAFGPLYEAERVALVTEIAESLPPVWADGERIQQVLGNLLANALRYAPQNSESRPAVRLMAVADGEAVRFSVIDNGPGLAIEDQAQVFERFWRGDGSRNRTEGGSGLGLAISRAIVVAHGGRIWLESQQGQGTAFHFTLPLGAGL